MKIGIMGTRGIPNQYGGFEQFTQTLARGLVKRGHAVSVYSSGQHPYQKKEWNGVQLIHCKDPEHRLGTFGQFFYDLNCIKDARQQNFDVLFHFGYSSDSFWWRRWPKQSVNIMNMDGLEWKRTKYNRFTRTFLKHAESLAARKSDQLIADSKAMQDYILRSYGKQAHFISYGADVFTGHDPYVLSPFQLKPYEYFLAIARMEPENNIEMILQGYLQANHKNPLLLIGGMTNKYGKMLAKKYKHPSIISPGPIYDHHILNHLRFYSGMYFHGHSVGGTNPSLLEAMACECQIAAHDNEFNKAVLGDDAFYFSTAAELAGIISTPIPIEKKERNKWANREKIMKYYDPEEIVDAYEKLAMQSLAGR